MKENKSYQKGSIRKRGNKYYYRFRMEEPDGTMKIHEFAGTESKRETEQMLKKALAEYNETGRIADAGSVTLSELMDEWFAVEIEPSSRASTTRDSYRNVMDHIRAHSIGRTRLKDLTIEHLQSYVDEKYYGEYDEQGKEIKHAYSESTMKEEFVVLNGIFKYAVYPKEYLRVNPMSFVRKRKKPAAVNLFGEDTEKLEIISQDQFRQIEEFLLTHRNSYGQGYQHLLLPIQISYYTGLRAGELCGLCWDDIDLKANRLIVRRSMYQDTGNKCWELKTPKNGKQRTVDFGASLAAILADAKAMQAENEKTYGKYYQKHYCQVNTLIGRQHYMIYTDLFTENGIIGSRVGHGLPLEEADRKRPLQQLSFVCRKRDGELVTPQTLKNCNKLIQSNFPDIPFHMHGLRHTYGSNMVACGANFKDLQMLMGHSDIGITLNTYAHVTEESRKSAVELLEQSLTT